MKCGTRQTMIGKTILKFDQLNSTNDYIKKNIVDLDDGTIVVAKQQTKGKGRHGNVWYSPEGNLYFSILVKKNVSRENLFLWTMRDFSYPKLKGPCTHQKLIRF